MYKQEDSQGNLLTKILGVKLTVEEIRSQRTFEINRDTLFQAMKKATESKLDSFDVSADEFYELYYQLKDCDILDFAMSFCKTDHSGTVISPEYLTDWIGDRIQSLNPKTIMITDAEKYLKGLDKLVKRFPLISFTLTTEQQSMFLLLWVISKRWRNVNVRFVSIYSQSFVGQKYDYIYSIPTYGQKIEPGEQSFFTDDSEGVAVEKLLNCITDNGNLDVIVPAELAFLSMGHKNLRDFIVSQYYVERILALPNDIFYPNIVAKTYLISITPIERREIQIGICNFEQSNLVIAVQKKMATVDFR